MATQAIAIYSDLKYYVQSADNKSIVEFQDKLLSEFETLGSDSFDGFSTLISSKKYYINRTESGVIRRQFTQQAKSVSFSFRGSNDIRVAFKNKQTGQVYKIVAGVLSKINEANIATEGAIAEESTVINLEPFRFSLGDQVEILLSKSQSNSLIIETSTIPFTLYDEFEEEVELVYSVNGVEDTSKQYTVESEMSPLDSLEGDYDIVIWTSQQNASNKSLTIAAVPPPQILTATKTFSVPEIKKVIVGFTEGGRGRVYIHVSPDNGVTWNRLRASEFANISEEDVKNYFKAGTLMFKVELEMSETTDVATYRSLAINDRDYYLTQNFSGFVMNIESIVEKTPKIFVSYDNEVTWVPVKQNEIANIGQEKVNGLTMKIVLENGQELYAIAYSWI